MAYLGKYETRVADFKVYTSSTATATHTLSWTPTSKQSLRITINGVVQQDDAFSLTGNTVTLDAAILVTDVLEIVGVNELGGQVLVPADGSIQAGKLGSNAVTTAKIQDDAVTLAKMADGTQGGVIHYGAAGAPVELAAGTDGYFLKTQGAGANPAWAAVSTTSDIELLNTYTPTDVADLEITTAAYFSSTYASLIFKFINMQPVTDNVHLRFSLGTGAGPTYDNDFYSMFASNQGHNATTGHWAQDTAYFSWPNTYATLFKELGNGADESCGGNLEVFNASSATYEKMFNASLTGHLYHDYMLSTWSAGGFNLATACTAIKFFFSSGNIANGIVKVYGAR